MAPLSPEKHSKRGAQFNVVKARVPWGYKSIVLIIPQKNGFVKCFSKGNLRFPIGGLIRWANSSKRYIPSVVSQRGKSSGVIKKY